MYLFNSFFFLQNLNVIFYYIECNMLVLYSSLGIIKIRDSLISNVFLFRDFFHTYSRDFILETFLKKLIFLVNYGYLQRYRLIGLGYKQKNYYGDVLQIKLRYSHILFRFLPYELLTYSISKRRKFHTIYGLDKSLVNQSTMLMISLRVANIYTKKGFFKKHNLVSFKKKAKRDKNKL